MDETGLTSPVLTKTHKDMETATQFIKAISNIAWSEYNRNTESNGTLKSEDGFSLSFTSKFNLDDRLPSVQIIAQVRYKDAYVMTWGFTDDASQREFITLLNRAKTRISERQEREDNWNGKIGRELFK
jgi:hypothetical protein